MPSGLFTGDLLEDVRKAAQWNILESINQGFEIPDSYALPDKNFHDFFKTRLIEKRETVTVLTGVPGAGKSTYLSKILSELEADDVPIVRHHYFLSYNDTTADRYSWEVVATSLQSQIKDKFSDRLGELANKNVTPQDLRSWLERCAESFCAENKPLIIIIDGLDHVYRERDSRQPLAEVFSNVLPVPMNVVLVIGTRDVSRDHFPANFLAAVPKDDWINLPFMDEVSVREWVGYYTPQIGVPDDERWREQKLNSIAVALYKKTQGYPLHLTYTFQALLETGQSINDENIAYFPECPGNDIQEYYRILMDALDEEGRMMLHILCECGFKWPDGALSQCLCPDFGSIPAIREAEGKIRHLLKRDRMGLSPYHVSLEEYVGARPDHDVQVRQAYPLVVRWLEEDAPDLWRWSYLWIIQQKNGNSEFLVSGPSEEWLQNAFLRGYPRYQIKEILGRAAWEALDQQNIVRALELNLMKQYAVSAEEYQTNGLQRLLFCQMRELWSDPLLKTRLVSEAHTLNDEDLAICAEVFAADDQIENVALFRQHFEKQAFSQKLPRSVSSESENWNDVYYLDIIASQKLSDAQRLLSWIRKLIAQPDVWKL